MLFIFLFFSVHLHTAIAKRQHLALYTEKTAFTVKAFDLDAAELERFLVMQMGPGYAQDIQAELKGLKMHVEVGDSISVVGNSERGHFSAFIIPRDGIVQRTVGSHCVEYHFESAPIVSGIQSILFKRDNFFALSSVEERPTLNSDCPVVKVTQRTFQLETVLEEFVKHSMDGSGIAAALLNLAHKASNGASLLEVLDPLGIEFDWNNTLSMVLIIFTLPVGMGLVFLCHWLSNRRNIVDTYTHVPVVNPTFFVQAFPDMSDEDIAHEVIVDASGDTSEDGLPRASMI